MGPSPKSNGGNGVGHKVTSENTRAVKIDGNTGKALRAFVKAIDSMSFDPVDFGQMIAQCELPVQRQFMRIVTTYFRILSERVDSGLAPLMDEDTFDHTMNARLIHENLRKFFPED